MGVLKVILFLCLYFDHVWMQNYGGLLQPCDVQDLQCLSHSTELFLEKTHAGIPQYDIVSLDPLVIPSLDIKFKDIGVNLLFKNINVTGLKTQKIEDFGMDTSTQLVSLTTNVKQLGIIADVKATIDGDTNVYNGVFSATADTSGKVAYGYSIVTDDKGVEHFAVGSETSDCKINGSPSTWTSVHGDIKNDPAAKYPLENYADKKEEYNKKIICEIVKEAYHSVVHNIRAAAKILPKTAFFTNV